MTHRQSLRFLIVAVAGLAGCANDRQTAPLAVDDYRAIHHLHAQQEPARPTVLADQNKDGRVTRDEAKVSTALTRQFDQVDSNKDGELDRAEFARLEASSTQARVSTADTDPESQPAPILIQGSHPTLAQEPDPRPREEYPRPRD